MDDLEGSAAVEPVDVSSDTEAVDISADQTQDDPPSEAPSEDLSTDSSEPDDSDGSTLESSEDDDKPVITRRNAKAIAEQAVQDALAAERRAREAEAQLAKQREAEEALTDEMMAFVGSPDEMKKLRDLVAQPIPVVDENAEDYFGAVRAQQNAVAERNAAMERLGEMTHRQELLPKMLSRVRASFASTVYDVFDSVANEMEGVDRAVFVDHLMGESLNEGEVKTRLRKAFDHLYAAGKAAGANDWKGRYEAEVQAHKVTKASAGGVPLAPASGGRPGEARIYTLSDLANMSLEEYRANAKEIERQAAEGLIK